MTASKFDARIATSMLAQPCPGGPGHHGPTSPQALCPHCLTFALDSAYKAGVRDEQVRTLTTTGAVPGNGVGARR